MLSGGELLVPPGGLSMEIKLIVNKNKPSTNNEEYLVCFVTLHWVQSRKELE